MIFIEKIYNVINGNTPLLYSINNYLKHLKYSFEDTKCNSVEQYRASIIRLYHTIEKGLSYSDYRPGFGKDNIDKLIVTLEQYSKKYDIKECFYETALDCLYKYIKKNLEFGVSDAILESRIKSIPGNLNGLGGTIEIASITQEELKTLNYENFIKSRHSIRHFGSEAVDVELLREAIQIAQYTPSACNRQGWVIRIVESKDAIDTILENQNGNRGFGHEIDKLVMITCDVRAFQKNRELFQPYIDGGMYAQSVLNALYYKGIGAIPLSASLAGSQEKKIRKKVGINKSEVFILFIGVGTYPDSCKTTRSERMPVDIRLV